MLALRIAIFLLCVNASLSWVVSTGLLPGYQTDTPSYDSTEITRNMPDLNYSSNTITTYIFGDFPRMIPIFVKIIGYSTILLPVMLAKFNMPLLLVALMTLLSWLFYALAAIQIIANRSEKLMR